MRLWAISDLHLDRAENLAALTALPAMGADWLVVAGDLANRAALGARGLDLLVERFGRVIWVPGNHELWTLERGDAADRTRGEARYRTWVELCRLRGVLTPEDPYAVWDGPGGPATIAPLFLLYDYSFRPPEVAVEQVLSWAMEEEILPTDEILLHPDPHAGRAAWCAARCAETERRLDAVDPALPTVLINHWPLRRDLVHIPLVPRFLPWCGTTRTERYHLRFRASVVVNGHLHVRRTLHRDATRFEEVSFGYPRQWAVERGVAGYLRQILPAPGADLDRA